MSTMYRFNCADENSLAHYGVKGMKWGRRKAVTTTSSTRKRYDDTKREYKDAKKAYNKSYNKAYSYSANHPISQFTSKKRGAEADRRWNDTIDKADALNKAERNYKTAKTARKDAITKTHRDINKNATRMDRFLYNDATRRKAAKYVVDNNMSMAEANKRAKGDAIRNTTAVLAAYGAVTVASLYINNRN